MMMQYHDFSLILIYNPHNCHSTDGNILGVQRPNSVITAETVIGQSPDSNGVSTG